MTGAEADIPHAMGIPGETKRNLNSRLARIRGQVDGLARMIEEERYCPDVLQQFASVRASLKATERVLLANHLEQCASRAIQTGGPAADRVRREILDIFARYLE